MSIDSQQEVIDYLMSPRAHGAADVERIDTHSAVVFLAGTRAFKLKREVRFDYLDFSTPDLRRAACEAEVRINRRAAPTIYHRVVAVTRESDGSLSLGGQGRAVDWLIEMARFDQERLFDRLASRNALDYRLMEPLAEAIAEFHRGADRRHDQGGRAGMQWVIDGNAAGFAEQGASILDRTMCAQLTARAGAELERVAGLLDERQRGGFVRQCHGDLHLRNIVLIDQQPTLFDAVEFNDKIACIDVLYDLAFLLMDLWRRRLESHASRVLNVYIRETGDDDGVALLPLFLSCRAAVRAKTSATAARLQPDSSKQRELPDLAREYLGLAAAFLDPCPVHLIAVGGFSGSGKSTLARALAPSVGRPPGAVIVRSDEIRKTLRGVPSLKRLGPEGYTPEMTDAVYQTMATRVKAVLRTGQSVIADAVFSRSADRLAIEAAAADASVPFSGLWLEARPEVLIRRVSTREADASDADAMVVRGQLQEDAGPIAWHRVDAGKDPAHVLSKVRELLSNARTLRSQMPHFTM